MVMLSLSHGYALFPKHNAMVHVCMSVVAWSLNNEALKFDVLSLKVGWQLRIQIFIPRANTGLFQYFNRTHLWMKINGVWGGGGVI